MESGRGKNAIQKRGPIRMECLISVPFIAFNFSRNSRDGLSCKGLKGKSSRIFFSVDVSIHARNALSMWSPPFPSFAAAVVFHSVNGSIAILLQDYSVQQTRREGGGIGMAV
ncbi:hypothetical protein NPIL_666321 [Nephila pilipes]|uniref:Uncharacterized protein n=1 Tax=Nephila pilipes TaxID=299642 RepID=A0A8X6QL67_NEPPI|nr:hypothetical protein NPIL_666321 [Nephila pilipes]